MSGWVESHKEPQRISREKQKAKALRQSQWWRTQYQRPCGPLLQRVFCKLYGISSGKHGAMLQVTRAIP